jgi:hypothetical protein
MINNCDMMKGVYSAWVFEGHEKEELLEKYSVYGSFISH